MKRVCVLLALLASGCASQQFENRVACSAAGDQAAVISWWFAVGIAAKIAEADRAVVCRK